jgi:hypothetical protein
MALMSGATARASVAAMLQAAIEAFTQPGKPRGCMVMLGVLSCAQANQSVQDHLKERRCQVPKVIRTRLQRAVKDGDLPKSADLGALATFYATVLAGLALRARDGAPRAELTTAATGAMAAWEHLAAPATKHRTSAN